MARGRGRGRVGGAPPRAAGRGRGRGRGSAGSFLAPRTGRQASAAANAQASAEYNPGIHESREQIKGSRKREADLGSWYAQLTADYQGAQQAGSAALQSVEDTTTKQQQEAAARSGADQASLASSDEAFAALTGAPKDTAGLAKIAQAGAAAERARVDEAKLPISEQANFVARLGSDKAAARMQGIEQRRSEQRRRDKLKSDLAAQRGEKGAARVAAKDKIRESDRSYATDLKQLALSRREAAASERSAAADAALARIESARKASQDAIANRQAQQRIGISRRNARTAEDAQAATAKHYAKENRGGLTPSERRTRHEHAKNAAVEATNLYKAAKKPPKTDADWAAFTHLVAEQSEISPTQAARAVQRLRAAVKAQAATRNRRMHEGKIAGH